MASEAFIAREWCELGCEESELDKYLRECRIACEKPVEAKPDDKYQQYLICLWDSCLEKGNGPPLQGDENWLDCAESCNREEAYEAKEAQENSLLHTQYYSKQQYLAVIADDKKSA